MNRSTREQCLQLGQHVDAYGMAGTSVEPAHNPEVTG